MRLRTTTTLALTLALALTACGGDETPTDVTASLPAVDATEGTGDMTDMDMGDADSARADEVTAAELRQGSFAKLDGMPDVFADAKGKAYMALDPGTVVTVDLRGLPAGTEIAGHLHKHGCAKDGGPHFQFTPGGGDTPPNEVHFAGTANDEGRINVTVTNEQIASGAKSVVVHTADGTKALCANVSAA